MVETIEFQNLGGITIVRFLIKIVRKPLKRQDHKPYTA